MAEKCAWLISLEDEEQRSQAIASLIRSYGLKVLGQKWPKDQPLGWIASAEAAHEAGAAVIVVVDHDDRFASPAIRRHLALFRLSLQTRLKRQIDGFVQTSPESFNALHSLGGSAVLSDWLVIGADPWLPKLVARAHVPTKSQLPVPLGLHAHERLGVWLEVQGPPGQTRKGCVVGFSGNGAHIDFHAVGPSGRLPSKTVTEFPLQGILFEAGGHAFEGWGVQNTLSPSDSYFVRMEGVPDGIAIGELPEGEMTEVQIVCLA